MQTQTSSLDSSVARRLGLCAAALAGVAAAPAANAVVVTTYANTSIAVPANIDGVYLNFLNGATGTSGAGVTGWDFNAYLTGGAFLFFWPTGTGGGVATADVYRNLSVGDTISAASTFSASSGGGGTGSTIAFQTAGTHILGVRFQNETTGVQNYGYVTINNGASAGFPATITGWVYENTGAAITVTAVPEASTSAMMALGALALGAVNLRRIRRQRRTQA